MIDSVLNLIFRCPHRHLTRPITPVHRAGMPAEETYVVCLDCTKQFAYDPVNMRIGKPIERSHDAYVLPAGAPRSRHTGLKFALGAAAVPLAVLAGSVLSAKKNAEKSPNGQPSEEKPAAEKEKPSTET